MNIPDGEAVAKEIWKLYKNTNIGMDLDNMLSYYSNLQPDVLQRNISERK